MVCKSFCLSRVGFRVSQDFSSVLSLSFPFLSRDISPFPLPAQEALKTLAVSFSPHNSAPAAASPPLPRPHVPLSPIPGTPDTLASIQLLPARYRRRPLTLDEMDYIQVSSLPTPYPPTKPLFLLMWCKRKHNLQCFCLKRDLEWQNVASALLNNISQWQSKNIITSPVISKFGILKLLWRKQATLNIHKIEYKRYFFILQPGSFMNECFKTASSCSP